VCPHSIRPFYVINFINFINFIILVKRLVDKLARLYNVRMTDEMKTERVTTMMSPSEVKSIDDWAFANRIRSRGEAIRQLIVAGLTAKPETDDSGAPGGSEPRSTRKSAARPKATPTAKPR
jgi:hypothetical protein